MSEDVDFEQESNPLQSLFASPSQPMRPPHARPPSRPAPKALSLSIPRSHSPSLSPSPGTSHMPKHDRPHPVLRWFSAKHSRSTTSLPGLHSRSHTPSPQPTRSPTPSSSTPSTPSSAASALADALGDDPHLSHPGSSNFDPDAPSPVDLPTRPEAARLPAHFRPSQPPRFLSELTRSTLPTASLSPPPIYAYFDPFATAEPHNPDLDVFYSPTPTPVAIPHSPAPAHVNRSRAGSGTIPSYSRRSSLDTLREIQERERTLHITATQQLKLPSLPDSIRSWFSTEEEIIHPLLSEEDQRRTAEEEREHIRRKYYAPKNPIVFCHGLLGFDTVTLGPSIASLQVTHWRGIKEALEANGVEVLMTRVPATSTPIVRAKVLCEKISEVYPGRSVHLIGHSMGGLDCRYLTTHLTDRPFKVLSVTTISTPHRGSSFADHFLATVGRERMPSVLALLDLLPNGGGDGKAFEFLTVENMRKFNEETPDVPGVKYFSWGAVYEPGLIDTWKWPHSVVLEKEGPNDGLVSLKSAKWGTYLGTLEGVNHLDLIGWVNSARYKWAEIMGREVKFKPATFYLSIADHLARVVEGQGQDERREEEGEGETADTPERNEREEIRQEGERAEMADSLAKGATLAGEEGEGGESGEQSQARSEEGGRGKHGEES